MQFTFSLEDRDDEGIDVNISDNVFESGCTSYAFRVSVVLAQALTVLAKHTSRGVLIALVRRMYEEIKTQEQELNKSKQEL